MATEDIKVVTIPQESLQQVDPNNNYVIRFRISNEDGSQKSSWSPYITVPAKAISSISNTSMTTSISGNLISFQWATDANSSRPLYDVLARWSFDGGSTYTSYELVDTVTVTSVQADRRYNVTNTAANRVQFKIQVAGLTKEENNNILLGTSNVITLS